MLRLLILIAFLVFLSLQLGWVIITPKAHSDFKKITSFFSNLVASTDTDEYKGDIQNIHGKLNQTASKMGDTKTQIEEKGKIRHQISLIDRLWSSIKNIYHGFFQGNPQNTES